MVHYEATIRNPVHPDRIYKYLDQKTGRKLRSVFGNRPIRIWGQEEKPGNRSRFDRMREGDEILIVEGDTVRLLGVIACTTENIDLSHELWQPLRTDDKRDWRLIYFIANGREINLPFSDFNRLVGYKENYRPQGFTSVAEDKLEEFYSKYDDLYSILIRLKGAPNQFSMRRLILHQQYVDLLSWHFHSVFTSKYTTFNFSPNACRYD